MECIVVDDGSSIDIAEILRDSALKTILLRIPQRSGSAAARNMGAKAAAGDILLFVDDDVCVQPGSVAAVVAAFRADRGLGALIGRYDDAPSSPDFWSQFRNLLHAYTHRVSAGVASTFWTGFGAVRASLFFRHGGFNEAPRKIDDVEFGTRMADAGVRIELRPELQVKHLKRWTLRSMISTDLFLRGIPWTLLVWRQLRMPNTLNLRLSSRLSVLLVCASVILTGFAIAGRLPWFAPGLCALLVLLLNVRFYAFLRGRNGNWFALRGVGAHCIYFLIAGSSFVLGSAIYMVRWRRTNPSVETLLEPIINIASIGLPVDEREV
jgi:GT2 family glycosyltransferase